jgi:hypothetical protein
MLMNRYGMKRIVFLTVLIQLCICFLANAQELFQGINYQAVARDASGEVLSNLSLNVNVAFVTSGEKAVDYYSEWHEVKTDANGFFQLVVGYGDSRKGYLSDVPWAMDDIWLRVAINSPEKPDSQVTNTQQLFSVPYALFANSARQLTPADELALRNQSIYWTSTGNVDTRPPYHFLGNRDAKPLVFKTNSETRATFTRDGQLQIKAGSTVNGPDDMVASYPVYIKGANQGIHIKVNGSRDGTNNFLTFADPIDIHGRVEGQTYIELISNPFYIIQAAVYAIEGAKIIATTVGLGIQLAGHIAAGTGAAASLIFAFAAPGFYTAAAGNGIKIGVQVVEAASLLTNSINWAVSQANNVGVSFSSGGADYAEYLLRSSNASPMEPGDIVGVRGGVISKQTQGGDHLMVVSRNPGFLGNVPESEELENYEKVAFLGQVKVKVSGAVEAGDFILPSGNNDGVGIAVHPDSLAIADFSRIVGVAWESAEAAPLNMVNCAIGMTQNELAPKVEEVSNKVDNIINYLQGKGPLRPAEQTTAFKAYNPLGIPEGDVEKIFSDREFDRIIDQNADELRVMYAEAEEKLRASREIDFFEVPGLAEFFADPISQLKELRRDPKYDGPWGKMDHYFIQQFGNTENK